MHKMEKPPPAVKPEEFFCIKREKNLQSNTFSDIIRKEKISGGVSLDKKEEHVYIAIDLKSFYASVECQ